MKMLQTAINTPMIVYVEEKVTCRYLRVDVTARCKSGSSVQCGALESRAAEALKWFDGFNGSLPFQKMRGKNRRWILAWATAASLLQIYQCENADGEDSTQPTNSANGNCQFL